MAWQKRIVRGACTSAFALSLACAGWAQAPYAWATEAGHGEPLVGDVARTGGISGEDGSGDGVETLATQDDVIATGTWGTCPWQITDDGTLTIGAGIGDYSSPWDDYKERFSVDGFEYQVISIVVDGSAGSVVAPSDCTRLFDGFLYVTTMDLAALDTSNVESMRNMFCRCESITTLDLSDWNTDVLVDVHEMFWHCTSLKTIDISGWNTASVEVMSNMFIGCSSLETINAPVWRLDRAYTMSAMFKECGELRSIDMSGLTAPELVYADEMFRGCGRLKTANFAGFTAPCLESLSCMFMSCPQLESADLSNLTSSRLRDLGSLFAGCERLRNVDVSDMSVRTLESLAWAFDGCSTLRTLDLSTWYTPNLKNLDATFRGCDHLADIDVSHLATSNVETFHETFRWCSLLSSLDLSSWRTSKAEDLSGVFDGCTSLSELEIPYFNTSSARFMNRMFEDCQSITSIGCANWNTAKVEEMNGVFRGCRLLTTLDPSRWNTVSLWDTEGMFEDCESLESLDLSRWDTRNLWRVSRMFAGCRSLSTVSLANWNACNMGEARQTFMDCESLTMLDLSGWETPGLYDIGQMFSGCSSLVTLDLTGLETAGAFEDSDRSDRYVGMYAACNALTELRVGTGYVIGDLEAFPMATSQAGAWWSEADERWYTCEQIMEERSGVADTYLASEGQTTDLVEAGAQVTLSKTAYTYSGSARKPTVTVTIGALVLQENTDFEVAYKNNKNAGTATVTVTGIGSYTGTLTSTFTISAKSLKSAEVTLSPASYTYSGSARKPVSTVVLAGKTLTKDTDYTLSYKDNVDAGTATVTITGKGNYKSAVSAQFTIKAKSLKTAEVALTPASYTYDGNPCAPVATVVLSGKTLVAGTDYTVEYADNVAAGTAMVTVTGKGNYKGSVSATFTIKMPKVKLSKLTGTTKAFTAKWAPMSGASGYQLQYATDSAFTQGKKNVTVAAGTTSKKVSKLTSGTTYYVRIRAYAEIDGVKYYTSWSTKKSVVVG